jgi:hypothetical protein
VSFHDERFVRPTFAEAVKGIASLDAQKADWEQSLDEHFLRQSRFCGGLANTLEYYDTVEALHKSTARYKVNALLERVGVPR